MIVVVTGLPRSGTSLMMQMLHAGGLPVLCDDQRPADDSNPAGYFEFEPVRRIDRDTSWLTRAEGKAVKVVSPLLRHLPNSHDYRLIFMTRDLHETLRSQSTMLSRLGTDDGLNDSTMADHFSRHLRDVREWIREQAHFAVLDCDYARLVADPASGVDAVCDFLGVPLDRQAMREAIRPELYRQRGEPEQ
jgi:hypothetical protein